MAIGIAYTRRHKNLKPNPKFYLPHSKMGAVFFVMQLEVFGIRFLNILTFYTIVIQHSLYCLTNSTIFCSYWAELLTQPALSFIPTYILKIFKVGVLYETKQNKIKRQ
jgi:hypothetical protein